MISFQQDQRRLLGGWALKDGWHFYKGRKVRQENTSSTGFSRVRYGLVLFIVYSFSHLISPATWQTQRLCLICSSHITWHTKSYVRESNGGIWNPDWTRLTQRIHAGQIYSAFQYWGIGTLQHSQSPSPLGSYSYLQIPKDLVTGHDMSACQYQNMVMQTCEVCLGSFSMFFVAFSFSSLTRRFKGMLSIPGQEMESWALIQAAPLTFLVRICSEGPTQTRFQGSLHF